MLDDLPAVRVDERTLFRIARPPQIEDYLREILIDLQGLEEIRFLLMANEIVDGNAAVTDGTPDP